MTNHCQRSKIKAVQMCLVHQTVVDMTINPDTAEDQESFLCALIDDKTVADNKGSSSCSHLLLKQNVDIDLRAPFLTVDDQESLGLHLSAYPTFGSRFNAIFLERTTHPV